MLKKNKYKNNNYCNGILYLTFIDGLKWKGCPICRLTYRYETNRISNILYEHATDSITIGDMIKRGLCARHAWQLFRLAKSSYQKFEAALIYKVILNNYINNIEERKNLNNYECILCNDIKKREEDYINLYVKCLLKYLSKYNISDAIFCVKHYNEIFKRINDKKIKIKFQEIHLYKIKNLYNSLNEFINKHDYMRSSDQLTQDELDALRYVIEILHGFETL